jgi:DNA-binding MarR family transcriptional regulator
LLWEALPQSALRILNALAKTGPLSPKEIHRRTKMASRTISFALNKLTHMRLCKRIPNLLDMRQPLYCINDNHEARSVFRRYGIVLS